MTDSFSSPKELRENLPHGTLELAYSIHHTKAESPLILYRHWHEEGEFFVIEKGKTDFLIGSEHFTLSAGDAMFIPPYCIHEAVSNTTCQFYAIVFQPSFLIGDSASFLYRRYISPVYQNIPANVNLFRGSDTSSASWEQDVASSILNLCRTYIDSPYVSPLFVKAQLLVCWQNFFQHRLDSIKIQKDSRILEVISFLRDHFHEEITIPRLSKLVNLSEGQLSRLFKQQTGLSIISYLTRIRLTYACRLLTEGDKSVSEIAFSCGFYNISNFNRLFKKNLHCSPLTYRKQKNHF